MGAVNQLLAKHNVQVRRSRMDLHRDQAIVERFNWTLAERLFGHQYAQEMLLAARGSSERSAEWVTQLPALMTALNNEPTSLTAQKPKDAIKAPKVAQKLSSVVTGRSTGLTEPLIESSALVRYLYQLGELEGRRRRATDPMWSLTTHTVRNVVGKEVSLRCTTSTMGLLVNSFGRSFWSFLGALSCRLIVFSCVDVCFANGCPSISVTLETGQSHVITTVAPGVV